MEKTKEELAAELAAEQEAIAGVKEEEVRASVIAEYGFDEVDDAERIDKLVAKEVENSRKLSSAIGQKIKHRTEAETLRNDPRLKVAPSQDKTNVLDTESLDKKFDEKFNERMEKLDLEALDYSDEVKADIKKVAKAQGISVKQAVRDPYIVFKIGETEKEQKTNEASISRTNKTHGKKAFSMDNPPEVDMTTEEGRKEWEAYKTEMKKQGY